MWCALRNGAGIACIRLAFLPIQRKQLDEDRISSPSYRDLNSGVDRVMSIFDRDEYGTISPEASFINFFGFTGGMLGAMYGGLQNARIMNMRFRETNEATVFETQKLAQRKLIDSMTLGFGRGAARFGIRYAVFCFSFAGFSTMFQRFRGETGIMEYSFGGLISGALYKFSLGPKGMFSGGFFGAFLGTVGGALIYTLTKITDFETDDAYKLCKTFFTYKDRNFHSSFRKHLEKPDVLLDTFYPDGLDSMEHTLNELEDIQSISELKYNKNPSLNLNIESKHSVNITNT